MAHAAGNVADILKDLECPICLDIFDNPKELTCPHVFCKTCLDGVIKFNRDGAGTIKCALCNKESFIGKRETTNDLRTALLIKNMAEKLSAKKRLDDGRLRCLTRGCDKDISGFCAHCEKFSCDICQREHNHQNPNHRISKLSIGKDRTLKVRCEIHNTLCDFMCCRNKIVCVYCINREHFTHDFRSLEENVGKLRDTLTSEVKRFQYLPDIHYKFNISLMESRKQFEEAINCRKMDCLSRYLVLLENEEDRLRKQFDLIYTEHHNDFAISQSAAELFEKYIGFNDIQLALMRSNILETIIRDRCPNVFPCLTASLSDYNFTDAHPLGELSVSIGEIAVTDLEKVPTFNVDMPEVHTDEENFLLLQRLKDLVQKVESYSRMKEDGCSYNSVTARSEGNEKLKECDAVETYGIGNNGEKDSCIQLFERRGAEYIEELIKNDEREKLSYLFTKKPSALNMRNFWNDAPIHLAVENNKKNILKLLVRSGCCVDALSTGRTALHYAVWFKSEECLHYLCTKCPQLLNVGDTMGFTPLHYAVEYDDVNFISILCSYNIDTSVVNEEGRTALQEAKDRNFTNCVRVLEYIESERTGEVSSK